MIYRVRVVAADLFRISYKIFYWKKIWFLSKVFGASLFICYMKIRSYLCSCLYCVWFFRPSRDLNHDDLILIESHWTFPTTSRIRRRKNEKNTLYINVNSKCATVLEYLFENSEIFERLRVERVRIDVICIAPVFQKCTLHVIRMHFDWV